MVIVSKTIDIWGASSFHHFIRCADVTPFPYKYYSPHLNFNGWNFCMKSGVPKKKISIERTESEERGREER